MHVRAMQIVLTTIAFGAVGIGFMYAGKDDRARDSGPVPTASRVNPTSAPAPVADAAVENDDSSPPAMVETPKALTPDDVTRLVSDTTSGDPSKRASAILALVNAPKAAAIPALHRIVEGGEPNVDRPLALQALRDLALYQGDADGVIRGVVRETIYHADDETLVERAQVALEIIEESEMGASTP